MRDMREDSHAAPATPSVAPVGASRHTLVIPKRHCATLENCDVGIARHLIGVTQKLNVAVRTAAKCDGILNVVVNGEAAGQEIFHLHFHIIPLSPARRFWVGLSQGLSDERRDRRELDSTANMIRNQVHDLDRVAGSIGVKNSDP